MCVCMERAMERERERHIYVYCIYAYICLYTHMYVCMYIYIYIVKPLWTPLGLTSMLEPPFQVKPFARRSDASQVVGGRGS